MNQFSRSSRDRLATCHPDLQYLFNEVIKQFDCSVVCGHRNKAEQEAAYPKYSKVRYPNSKHNSTPSIAVDVIPYPTGYADEKTMCYFAGHVMIMATLFFEDRKMMHRVRWGGDWDRDTELNDQKFVDLPHFELVLDE